MFRKLAAPAAITVLFTAAPAFSDQDVSEARDSGADHYERTFSGENASGNPEISDELNRDQAFDGLDRNRDGKLDQDELSTWGSTASGSSSGNDRQAPDERSRRMLDQFDRDDDDAISRDELDAGPSDPGDARGSNL